MAHSVPPPRCPACYFFPAAASEPRPAHTWALRVPGPASPPVISRKGTKVSISGMSAPPGPPFIQEAQTQFTAELSGIMNEPWLIRQHLFDFHYMPTCIAAGSSFSFFLSISGQVFATGDNSSGQLGLGEDVAKKNSFTLVTLPVGATRVVAIVAGGSHTFILTESGQVFAAGNNSRGQLGLGEDTRNRHHFELVTLPEEATRVVAIAAGWYHTFILTESGQVFAVGDNSSGQLGLGDEVVNKNSFTLVTLPVGAARVVSIAAGGYHTFILTERRQVFAVGDNSIGWLGLGEDTRNRHHFELVTLPEEATPVVAIAAGAYHTFILTESGQVFAAGWNNHGQFGLGDTLNRYYFTLVPLLEGIRVVSIAVGGSHTFILTERRQVFVAGWNDQGQLGLGDYIANKNSFAPVPLPKGTGVCRGRQFERSAWPWEYN
jgi:alpha-tubulin suppressor-like RCC1 family protein